jgi:hypothetical protein
MFILANDVIEWMSCFIDITLLTQWLFRLIASAIGVSGFWGKADIAWTMPNVRL